MIGKFANHEKAAVGAGLADKDDTSKGHVSGDNEHSSTEFEETEVTWSEMKKIPESA